MTESTSSSVVAEPHYEFGANWQHFIETQFSTERVETARQCLLKLLHRTDLTGETFLDIGSGSGLHSLAAWMSGAERVTSFDYDPNSVATTRQLHQLAGSPTNWTVQQGDVLSPEFLSTLSKHSIVYSWGVLHHTGAMWDAIRNARQLLAENGLFCIALYTSDHYIKPSAGYWMTLKQRYNQSGRFRRLWMEWCYLFRFLLWPELRGLRNPWTWYRNYFQQRGMNVWTDIRDWLGGWPMEYAGVMEMRTFCRDQLGLELVWMNAGEANTEYLMTAASQRNVEQDAPHQHVIHPVSGPFEPIGPYAYMGRVSELEATGDSQQSPRQSPWVLYEAGQPLTIPHVPLADIKSAGAGRYSHWKDRIYFSTIDGSNPNCNGRSYELRQRSPITIAPPIRTLTLPQRSKH
ncbi:MAG: class I SAM-dependent methyltransferase [Planctomycetaceae bacterium]